MKRDAEDCGIWGEYQDRKRREENLTTHLDVHIGFDKILKSMDYWRKKGKIRTICLVEESKISLSKKKEDCSLI